MTTTRHVGLGLGRCVWLLALTSTLLGCMASMGRDGEAWMSEGELHFDISGCDFHCGAYSSVGWFCGRSITDDIHTSLCNTGSSIIGNCETGRATFTLDENALERGDAPKRCVNYDYRCLDANKNQINPDPAPCPSS